MRLPWIAVVLAGLVLAVHAPALHGGVIGAAGTDVFRGVWGFDHQAQAWPLPFWTERVGFPTGVKLLILPFVSSLVAAPLHWILGPWAGYSAWLLLLAWAGALTTAWWVREASGSGAAGLLAGGAMITQPAVLLAMTDGTPEHVAFWAMPATLAALQHARVDPGQKWGVFAGIFATVVALDSPYHAIFTVPLALLPLWRCPPRARWAFLGVSLLGAAAVVGLYWGLPLAGRIEHHDQNAVKLMAWWEWDNGRIGRPWDFTYTPAFVPTWSLLCAVALAFCRPVRAGAWLGLAAGTLALSLGSGEENAHVLGRWWGAVGEALGDAVAWLNGALGMDAIRFPRRWLLPFALCTWTAAGIGLGRLPREWMRVATAVPVLLGVTAIALDRTGYREAFPLLQAPLPAFASFVRDHPEAGAAVTLPTMRGASRLHERWELPIFANLDPSLASADGPFLQVAMGRAVMNAPTGLFTMTWRTRRAPDLERLLQDLNDLCTPQTTGAAIPGSALQEPERRAKVARALIDLGLRFVVLDEEIYGEEGLIAARLPFEGHIAEDRHFDDGTGVTVLVLSSLPTVSTAPAASERIGAPPATLP